MGHGKGPLTRRLRRPKAGDDARLKLEWTDTLAAAARGTIEVTRHLEGTRCTHVRLRRFHTGTIRHPLNADLVRCHIIALEFVSEQITLKGHDMFMQLAFKAFKIRWGLALLPVLLLLADEAGQTPKGGGLHRVANMSN